MGVLTNIRNTVVDGANKVKNQIVDGVNDVLGMAADGITTLSQLSPSQVEKLAEIRNNYLNEMPDTGETKSYRNLEAAGIEIFNSFFPKISSIYLPIEEAPYFDADDRITYFQITKWVKDPSEDNIEKLMNIYQVLSEEKCNIALIYHRKLSECCIYLAIVNNSEQFDRNEVKSYKKRLLDAIIGNFPGAEIIDNSLFNVPDCLKIDYESIEDLSEDDSFKSVAIVSNLATEKSEKFKSQTIEKLLDGIVPEKEESEYILVLLATPVQEQMQRKNRLFELYNGLSPYSTWQTNYTMTEMNGESSSASIGFNLGLNIGQQQGNSNSIGTTTSESNSETMSKAQSKSESTTKSANAKFIDSFLDVGISKMKSVSKTVTKATTTTLSAAHSASKIASNLYGFGISAGTNFARTSNVSVNLGKNEGITQNFVNYGVKHALELLEKQLLRLEESAALGLWDFATYVISEDSVVANNVAHTYLALSQGEESFLSQSAVNLWRGDLPEKRDFRNEKGQAAAILKSLSRLQHPEFCLKPSSESEIVYPSCITATTSLSGKEMARSLNFPSKSIQGLPVIETASFGRGVSSYNKIDADLSLGKAYHMHQEDKKTKISLSKNSLTSHVFVTGSTGTGKTNTVVGILEKTCLLEQDNKNPTFMVVEPAKGEYKSLLGHYKGVTVYGTNPKFSLLLKLNPFSFPENISVTEHIDRLVEIFNVCWPMYAAMPVILKDAILRAYQEIGWDIAKSTNKYSNKLYPNFIDVMVQVKNILNSSDYSGETKGDYTGALVSRLNSLTNGINGQIFSNNALTDEALFDENVIIDLSRIGSVETKSLIMGILLLKLQEYRLSTKQPNVEKLEHITVLEEAHNLLRRTSFEQSSESSNLLGKSVEMLTNAIAELRAFGESFFIVDQAPELLDKAAIRNTNTKIVHRLPEQVDRILTGKAMALKDEQINELAKLELGIAAVYQNDWIESVLCKVDKVDKKNRKYNISPDLSGSAKDANDILLEWLMGTLCAKSNLSDIQNLKDVVISSNLSAKVKTGFFEYINASYNLLSEKLGSFVYDFFNAEKVIENIIQKDNIDDLTQSIIENLNPTIKGYSSEKIHLLLGFILNEQAIRNRDYIDVFCRFTEDSIREGRIY